MCVVPREGRDPTTGRDPIPAVQGHLRSIQHGGERRSRTPQVPEHRSREADRRIRSATRCRRSATRGRPARPSSRSTPAPPGGVRVRDDAEAAEATDVFRDRRGLPAEPIRRGRQPERDVVAAVRADFDGVDAQHAARCRPAASGCRVASPWSVNTTNCRPARAAAAAIAGRSRAVRDRALWTWIAPASVRGDRAPGPARRSVVCRRAREAATAQKMTTAATRAAVVDQCVRIVTARRASRAGRRHRADVTHGRRRRCSASALSVRSQVNSGSVRPKWPNAAVLR